MLRHGKARRNGGGDNRSYVCERGAVRDTSRVTVTTNPQVAVARQVASAVLPVGAAILPFGLVLDRVFPSVAVDAAFVALALFTTALVAVYAPVPPLALVLACGGVIVVALTQRPNLFAVTLIPLVVVAFEHVDARRAVRRFTVTSAVLFAAVVAAYLLTGFNGDNDFEAWRTYSSEFVQRQALGFSHPNRAMMEWAVIVLAIMGFASPRARGWWLIPLLAVTAALYTVTDSRASGIVAGAFIALVWLFRRRLDRPVPAPLRGLTVIAPILFAAASFALPLLRDDPAANGLLTGRPAVYGSLLDTYPIATLFGTQAVEEAIVDNGFIHFALSKGIPLTVLYIGLLMWIIRRAAVLSLRTVAIVWAFLALALVETTLLEFALLFLVAATVELDRSESPHVDLPVAGRDVRRRDRHL